MEQIGSSVWADDEASVKNEILKSNLYLSEIDKEKRKKMI